MKVGEIVMFVDEGRYAKWFYGQLAIIESYTAKGSDGKAHCAVRWIEPVQYFDRKATVSHFSADKFRRFDENR